MSNYKLKSEILQVNLLINIILALLYQYKELSLIKIIYFTYLMKKECNNLILYSNRSRSNLFDKGISCIANDIEFMNTLKYILESIDILVKSNKIKIYKNMVINNNINYNIKNNYVKSTFLDNVIKESIKISDRQLMKEIMENV